MRTRRNGVTDAKQIIMIKYSTILVILLVTAFMCGCQPDQSAPATTEEVSIATTETAVAVKPAEERPGTLPDMVRPDAESERPVVEPVTDVEQPLVPEEDTRPAEETHEDTVPTVTAPAPAEEKETPPAKDGSANDAKDNKTDTKAPKPAYYDLCRDILETYVDKNGNVDYATLRRKRSQLFAAERAFNSIDSKEYIFWSRNDKIAMWINAYNIFTLRFIVENYPIQAKWYMLNYPENSIWQIQGKATWTKEYFNVMQIQYSLREIEREILLAKFKDPRVCFALSYGTRGGAFLRNEVYDPEKLEQQLDDQAKKFMKSPRGMRIDKSNKTIYLSDIFNWYRQEIIAKYGEVKKFRERPQQLQACFTFISDYVSTENLACLQSTDYSVEYLRYDWELNEQPQKPQD